MKNKKIFSIITSLAHFVVVAMLFVASTVRAESVDFPCPDGMGLKPSNDGSWSAISGNYVMQLQSARIQEISELRKTLLVCNYGTMGGDPVELSQVASGACILNFEHKGFICAQ